MFGLDIFSNCRATSVDDFEVKVKESAYSDQVGNELVCSKFSAATKKVAEVLDDVKKNAALPADFLEDVRNAGAYVTEAGWGLADSVAPLVPGSVSICAGLGLVFGSFSAFTIGACVGLSPVIVGVGVAGAGAGISAAAESAQEEAHQRDGYRKLDSGSDSEGEGETPDRGLPQISGGFARRFSKPEYPKDENRFRSL